MMRRVLVTGGAGYVGAVLVPKLLAAGHTVRVLDLYIFGEAALEAVRGHPRLEEIRGDLRDLDLVDRALEDCDAVIHLACVSNDPSFELDPEIGKSINFDCFEPMVDLAIERGVKRFVYASSSSVYGIKDEERVTEELPLEPLTDYSKYKALCEEILLAKRAPGFTRLVLRPATVCGYSPRLRLDLTVNILTNHAVRNRRIRVFGGSQLRPNIHIDDVTDLYVASLAYPAETIDGKVFNAGYENHSVAEIAEIVRSIVGEDVEIETSPTDDLRSYKISSDRIREELGYAPKRSIEDAVRDLLRAFEAGKIPDSLGDPGYFNVKRLQELDLRWKSLA